MPIQRLDDAVAALDESIEIGGEGDAQMPGRAEGASRHSGDTGIKQRIGQSHIVAAVLQAWEEVEGAVRHGHVQRLALTQHGKPGVPSRAVDGIAFRQAVLRTFESRDGGDLAQRGCLGAVLALDGSDPGN